MYKSEYLDFDGLRELQGHDPFDSFSFLHKPPRLPWLPPQQPSRIISNGSSFGDDNDDDVRRDVRNDITTRLSYPPPCLLSPAPACESMCYCPPSSLTTRTKCLDFRPSRNEFNLNINLIEAYNHDIWTQLGFSRSARRKDFLTFHLLKAQHQDGWFQLDVGSMAEWKKYLDSFFKDDCKMKLSDHLKGGLRRSLARHLQGHPKRHGNIVISLGTIQQLQSLKSDIAGRQTMLNDLSKFQPNCSPQYISGILADLEAKCSEWEVLEDNAVNTVLSVAFIMEEIIQSTAVSPILRERLDKADLWFSQNLQDDELEKILMIEAVRQLLRSTLLSK